MHCCVNILDTFEALLRELNMEAVHDIYASVDSLVSEAVIGTLKTMLQSSPNATGHHFEYTLVSKSEVRLAMSLKHYSSVQCAFFLVQNCLSHRLKLF